MKKTFLAAFVAPFILAACVTPVPYVDPKYDAAPITVPAEVADMQAALSVEFYRNGERAKSVDKPIRKVVVAALEKRGVEVSETATTKINVSMNNMADLGDAAASGFGTGLTLGLAGSTVSDFYKATVTIDDGVKPFSQSYDHALHTTVGRVKEPPIAGVLPAGNVQSAISSLVGDIIDQALFDYVAAKSPSVAAVPVAAEAAAAEDTAS